MRAYCCNNCVELYTGHTLAENAANDIHRIVDNLKNVKIYKYSEVAKRFNIKSYDFEHYIAPSEYGCTIYDPKKGRWLLFYNETKSEESIRFTLAHELGHIILKHTNDNEFNEREANCFARNILYRLPINDFYSLIDYIRNM
ncbi:MAG: ImmA/IrrE family metallo-endopeptidase [Ruminococcaceae bacterium]|nr:ImmA/IrrE family metallo-endopeptidase [Oscillospiraceae bacterium]